MARSSKLLIAALVALGGLALASAFAVPTAQLSMLTKAKMITDLAGQNLELNPYGLVLITKSSGTLVKGNFLATQWNDVNNNPGQGHTILQVTPQGTVSTFATITTANANVAQNCGKDGVGLTMALTILSKGIVIVGSTPVKVGQPIAGTGCLIALDTSGNILGAHAANEPTSTPGVMTGGGPWAFAVQETPGGTQVNLFVSYVLGTNPKSNVQLNGTNGGMVVRYGLQVLSNTVGPNFWGNAPDVVASGFPTVPAQITAGVVGPTGLLLVKDPAHNDRLYISNNLNSSVGATPFPGGCFLKPNGTPKCAYTTHVWGGLVNGPVGLALSPTGSIVGANGNIGTLFEFLPGANKNNQIADQLVNNGAPTVGAGTLFNVLFLNAKTLVYNDDGLNQFITLSS